VLARILADTERLFPEFLQLGSDAGRFSCQRPNVQQIPATKEYRSCFIASLGHKLIKGDWSQFELRILAEFSQDAGMIEAFHAGLDMHVDTAARMFGLSYDQVLADSKARQGVKSVSGRRCLTSRSVTEWASDRWRRS
jgi:DNA polymerase I-like protein with 3'-5' exonuclease and polymerase domains